MQHRVSRSCPALALRVRRRRPLAAVVGAVLLALAGCGGSASGGRAPADTAPAEGQLSLLVPGDYPGAGGPVLDLLGPFEATTGCRTTLTAAATSAESLRLAGSGRFDGLLAPGEVAGRLIASGSVTPLNTGLVASYADTAPFLRLTSYNSRRGVPYGVPAGWRADLLLSNPAVVRPAPSSWAVMFDPTSPYRGRLTLRDSPLSIADAALALSASRPELAIGDPFALTRPQFTAAVQLLQRDRGLIGGYWSDPAEERAAFSSGALVLGTGWSEVAGPPAATRPATLDAVVPTEGTTARSDTWLVRAGAAHPGCMYRWLAYITSAPVEARVAEAIGEAPANLASCRVDDAAAQYCALVHAADAGYHQAIHDGTWPTATCVDGRPGRCIAYADWEKAWVLIKG